MHAPGLAIVEKHEQTIAYLYPVIQRFPRRHGVARDAFLNILFDQVALLHQAAKSGQPSKLYAADANLATLRFWLRFTAGPAVRAITPRQHKAAQALVAETGAMLGQWIKTAKGKG